MMAIISTSNHLSVAFFWIGIRIGSRENKCCTECYQNKNARKAFKNIFESFVNLILVIPQFECTRILYLGPSVSVILCCSPESTLRGARLRFEPRTLLAAGRPNNLPSPNGANVFFFPFFLSSLPLLPPLATTAIFWS
jgi:hypothetical protein